MGQYYKVVNLDKKQYLHPHKFGDGLKLLEFGMAGSGTMCALALLLSDGNGKGGGDLHIGESHPEYSLVGSWAGDRIVIAGDYADSDKWGHRDTLYSATKAEPAEGEAAYEDISWRIIEAMCVDRYLRSDLKQSISRFCGSDPMPQSVRNALNTPDE